MIKISLRSDRHYGYKWFSCEGIYVKGYLFTGDGTLYREENLLSYFKDVDSRESFLEKITKATGLFSVIVNREDEIYAAVDVVRTFPLFYYYHGEQFILTDAPSMLFSPERSFEFDDNAVLQFEALGYVLGKGTLLNGVYQIQAGECLSFGKNQVYTKFYVSHYPPLREVPDRNLLKEEFREMLSVLSKRLVRLLDGRPVALPLSGGYDSRLLLYMLKQENYKDVLCFTYGAKNSQERYNAEMTASVLGYRWIFIDYSEYLQEDVIASERFRDWIEFTSNYTSFFYFQEYLAAYYLKTRDLISGNTVFIPGHTADVIAGSHLMTEMENIKTVKDLAFYVFSRNANLRSLNGRERKQLSRDIIKTITLKESPREVNHVLYEIWEQRERQAKQIVNSSKIWDFFGYQYVLPFWDTEFTSFFACLPFSYKSDKNFYNEAIGELFSEEGILFHHELLPSNIMLWKQRIKFSLMKLPFFPFLLEKKKLWLFDSVYFREFSKNLLSDLSKTGKLKRVLLYNGVLSAWYIYYIKRNRVFKRDR
ncbi:MAG: asparagine synthase-related protein [Bacteroidales bacterium]|nr:asparagine synthase-related protein [Bacteroidales bacterium]